MATTKRQRSARTDRMRAALSAFSCEQTTPNPTLSDRLAAQFGRSLIPVLIEYGLTSEDPRIREGSVWTLYHKFDCPAAAQAGIRKLIEDPHPKVRWYAVWAYEKYGPKGIDALRALIRRLKDPDVSVRSHALRTIGRIGPKAARAVEPIIACIAASRSKRGSNAHLHWSICSEGAKTLGLLRAKPQKSVEMLRKLLTHRYEYARTAAMEALAEFGTSALPALDDMVKVLKQNDRYQYSAGNNIAALGKKAFPRLLDSLSEVSDLASTIRGLKTFGVERSARAILERVRNDGKISPELASRSLIALGPEAVQVAIDLSCSV